MPRRKITDDSWTKEERKTLWECYLRSKPNKMGYRKKMQGIWKQYGMKEVRVQQLCDYRRHIKGIHWLDESVMETSKQKIEGQSTKDTEVAPVVQIVTEDEYVE